MTDNVEITPGTGKTIAGDDIGGVLHQRVKLSVGADGEATDLDHGQAAMAASLPVAIASDQSAVTTKDAWSPVVVADVTDNDSDKTFTVPASTEWQPLALHVTLTTTATAGNRQLAVLITTSADAVLAQVRPNVVQAASLTRYYSFGVGQPDDLAFYDTDLLRTPLPLIALPTGYKVRVYDNNAVDAAADDMHVQLTVLAR